MTKNEFYNTFEPPRLSRAWWLARSRSFLWVALVTALVWIYADVEFTDEMELAATVQLAAAEPGKLVLLSNSRARVNFTVQGRRSSLERLAQRLRSAEATIRYEVHEGDEDLPVRDVLNRDAFLIDEGLTVLSASPVTLRVRLDRKVYKADIPVKFEYAGAFPQEVTIDPPKMGLHVARSDWQEVLKAEPKPVLRTVRVDLTGIEDDKPFPVQIIRRIGDVRVEPDRPTVTVKVKIAQLTETEELTVGVQVFSPTSWMEDGTWKQYVLKRQNPAEWRAKVQVSGPRKDLDQLKSADVQAYVVLTDDDKKPVSWLTRQVEVRLPRALDLSLLGTKPTVTFKLEKLSPTATP